MDKLSRLWKWLLNPDNRATVAMLGGVAVTVVGGAWALYLHFAEPPASYEELESEVSGYIFAAELTVEFIEKDWTTKQSLTKLIIDYNQSITTLRKKEFVYLAWIRKYWGREKVIQYEKFMQSVRAFDSAIHSLNDEFEAVSITGSKQKVDRKRAEEALKVMKPAVESVRENGNLILTSPR
jgi:hypothetical protein